MNEAIYTETKDLSILTRRPKKNPVTPWRPYDYFVEKERTADGLVENIATILLVNRECPFRCLMCDLWKNTTDFRIPEGSIPEQIRWALDYLKKTSHIKLYNSGNFFDVQAIPPVDFSRIARLLDPFKTVIVECHPRLINKRCLSFRDLVQPKLQIAMGLETVHPDVLKRLNKRMNLKDFKCATQYLTRNGILVRAFILLRPPFLNEFEGVMWAKRSIDFAFDAGVECCVIIPTRGGNGALDRLQNLELFSPPRIESLEEVLEYGIGLRCGRAFADLWDVEKLSHCDECRQQRIQRMRQMNLTQVLAPPVHCTCGKTTINREDAEVVI
jgi:archaeosine synthase beta-subunit